MLNGTKLFVLDAHVADVIVVVARTPRGQAPEDGVEPVPGAEGRRAVSTVKLLPTMDQTRKLCEVKFDDVRVSAPTRCSAPSDGGWAPLARVLERATVALCAEMCGGAQRVLDMTTDYAKIRIAFGKPIGVLPGRQAQGRRHAGRRRERQVADVLRGVGGGRERRPRPAGGLDGQGVRVRRLSGRSRAPASSSTAASASPGSTTCTSTSSAPSRPSSRSATRRITASGSRS